MNFFLASDISNEISEKVSENNVENLKKVSSLFDNFTEKIIDFGLNIINAIILFLINQNLL